MHVALSVVFPAARSTHLALHAAVYFYDDVLVNSLRRACLPLIRDRVPGEDALRCAARQALAAVQRRGRLTSEAAADARKALAWCVLERRT